MLRTTEQPWLKDHVITDLVILPGVGYLTAVVEASLQLADPSQKVAGLRLKEVSLKRALIIPEGKEGVEVILSFTRMDEASLQGSAIWKRFNMSSYDAINEDWVEHCTGYVATDYETANNPIDEGLEAREEKAQLAKHLAAARATCSAPLDMNKTYEDWINAGIGLGPLFRNLSDVRCTPDMSREAYGIVTVPDVQEAMPSKFLHPHLIQPATMDAFMHLFIVSVVDGNKRKTLDRAIVPTLLKEVWISAKVGKAPGEKYVGHGKSTLLAYDKFESEVTIWDESSEEPLFTVRGIRSSPLDSAETSKKERKLCHSVITPLDPDLLTKEALDVTDLEPHDKAIAYKAWIEKWQLATVLRVTDALQEIQDSGFDINAIEGHFAHYYEWMKQVKAWLDNDEVRLLKLSKWQEYNADQALKETLYDEVDNDGPMGKLAMRMGSNIVKVIKKEVDPLHLMFGIDDLLDRVYSDLVALGDLPTYNRAFLNAIKESSTNLHILEVGAGVGSSTVPVLEALAPLGGENKDALSLEDLRVSKYTFTDVSARFFDKAKDKFKAHESIMEFKTFNIETGGDKQGLALGSYDYVFAGNVVHATQDLRKTLSNLQKMLKPGGKLVLQEGVRHDDFGWSIAFGQLPGWWLAVEPERKWSPWIPIPLWDTMLKDAGFGGVELNLADRHDPDLHSQSVIVARAEKVESSPQWEKVVIINSSREEGGFASKLRDYLTQTLKLSDCTVLHYLDISSTDVSQSVCLSVIELEKQILSSPSEEDFINIRQLLITSGALLWITGDTVAHPHLNMITGLIRTVRWERDIEEANLAILSIQEPALQEDQLLPSLARLFKQQFVQHLPQEKANSEFTLTSTGSFRTNRLVDADLANEYLTSRLRSPLPIQQRLDEAGRPLKLATSSPGQLDKLQWVTDELYDKPLGNTEVEIDIKAVGLNFRDLLVAMGEYMATSMGFEATGMCNLSFVANPQLVFES
jgi:SAM-dependent methyltransferase